jgi:hypothetical protein
MKLGRFTKTPVERKRYTIDYSDWLDTGETVLTVTFGVTPVTTNPLVVDAYLIATPATSVAYFVNDGIAGTTYTLDVQITTSGGQTKEDQVLYSVRDL